MTPFSVDFSRAFTMNDENTINETHTSTTCEN